MAKSLPHPPYVSVVIPIYNRADFVALCLPPLLKQTYPLDRYEIILVDDGSTDDTVMRASDLTRDWAGNFRLIQKPNGGPASARNAGLWVGVQAEIIAFIDSDCVVGERWLEDLVEDLGNAKQQSGAVGIGGPIVSAGSESWVSRYIEFTGLIRHRVRRGQVDYLTTANAAFYRQAILAVGGFDESCEFPGAEDPDLSFRLRQNGDVLAVTSRGSVQHHHRQTVGSLYRTLYRYGRGNFLMSYKWHNGRTPLVELIRHLGAIVLSPWLTLRRVRSTGFGWALAFLPLTIIEHTGFVVGLCDGIRRGRRRN